jgi:ribonuclease VapC
VSVAVLDASALLALLFSEPGAETVAEAIATDAAVSTVNLAEVATVLIRHDLDPTEVLAPVCEQVAVQPFNHADVMTAAALYPATAAVGLSLGDRACLALARRLAGPAVTAEHAWAELDLDVEIQLIRPRSR